MMHKPAPFPTLPIRRKIHSRWPAIFAVLFALVAIGLVVIAVRSRQRASDAKLTESEIKAPASPKKLEASPAKLPAAGTPKAVPPARLEDLLLSKDIQPKPSLPVPAPVLKPKPVTKPIPKLKAMPAGEVRQEFDKAAAILRQYFQSPPDDKLMTLLRHPEETMPRHREWERTRRIMPAMPLQIGPQFGVSGSLLITSVRLNDGTPRLAVLEKTDQGYRLDWESFVGWGESRFAELASMPQGRAALMRVSLKSSSATPPTHAPGGATFTITHPDERSTLAAYATAETLQSSLPARRVQQAGGGMFTVRLVVDENDAKSGLARIEEVVCSGWIPDMTESPVQADP